MFLLLSGVGMSGDTCSGAACCCCCQECQQVSSYATYTRRVAACLAGPRLRYVTPLPTGNPFILSCLLSLLQALADLTRLIQLIFLLLPVACWAPLALHYGCRRQKWTQQFRYSAQHDCQDPQPFLTGHCSWVCMACFSGQAPGWPAC